MVQYSSFLVGRNRALAASTSRQSVYRRNLLTRPKKLEMDPRLVHAPILQFAVYRLHERLWTAEIEIGLLRRQPAPQKLAIDESRRVAPLQPQILLFRRIVAHVQPHIR